MIIEGEISKGHQIASGQSKTGHQGLNNTIALQRPFFEKQVSGFSEVFNGTLNISIAPHEFKILKPDHEVTCEWHPGVTETFWLVAVHIFHKEKSYKGFIYYPLPSQVKSHADTTIEILAPKIEAAVYGDRVRIEVSPEKIEVV